MVDQVDLTDLLAGDPDMVRRDFTLAKLDKQDIQNRDFSGATFYKADLTGAALSQSTLESTNFNDADMNGASINDVKAQGASFTSTKLNNADMRNGNFEIASFAYAVLKGADIRGASFERADLTGTDLTGVIADKTTRFDGVQMARSRATANPLFKDYRVERGVLVRRADSQEAAPGIFGSAPFGSAPYGGGLSFSAEVQVGEPEISSSHRSEYPEIVAAIDKILADLREMAQPPPADQVIHGGIGHNGPPDDYPLNREEHDDLVAALTEVRVELRDGDVRRETVEAAVNKFDSVGWQIARWVGRKVDLAADEWVKAIGKNLADSRHLMGGYMIVSGQLANLSQALSSLLDRVA